MQIEHTALWTRDLERMKRFYQEFFQAQPGEKYVNPDSQSQSYFLYFSNGARLEIMTTPGLLNLPSGPFQRAGYAHIAFSLLSSIEVDALTSRLEQAGVSIARMPRRTGDGYYESVVLDPDGNRVEITCNT